MEQDRRIMNQDRRFLNRLQSTNKNEINLVEVFHLLLNRKKMIFVITFATILLALAYLLTTERVYQAEVKVHQPTSNKIQKLNALSALSGTNFRKLSNKELFELFVMKVKSWKFRKAFFKKNILPALEVNKQKLSLIAENALFNRFSNNLNIGGVAKGAETVGLTLDGIETDKIGILLDKYIEMANKEVIDNIIAEVKYSQEQRIDSYKRDIARLRVKYNYLLKFKLARLNQNYLIAKALGIHRIGVTSIKLSANNSGTAEAFENSSDDYMKGTKVILAEINILKKSISDYSSIKELPEMKYMLAQVQKANFDSISLDGMTTELSATLNLTPISPNRKQIIILSALVGLLLGILVVFLREFIINIKIGLANKNEN